MLTFPTFLLQSNYDLVDYINGLREGILEAYVGIIGSIKSSASSPSAPSPSPTILLPYISPIFEFLHLILTDQERTETILRSAIGLIGDLAECFSKGELKEVLSSGWVTECLKNGRTKMGGPETKRVAKWAKEVRFLSLFSHIPVSYSGTGSWSDDVVIYNRWFDERRSNDSLPILSISTFTFFFFSLSTPKTKILNQ